MGGITGFTGHQLSKSKDVDLDATFTIPMK